MATTTQLFKALRKLPDEEAAQTIADYMEESKQLNLGRMKEIFATKEDLLNVKLELHKEISNSKIQVIGAMIVLVLLQPLVVYFYKHFLNM